MPSVTISRRCRAGVVKGAGAEARRSLQGKSRWADEIRFVRLSQRDKRICGELSWAIMTCGTNMFRAMLRTIQQVATSRSRPFDLTGVFV